MAGNYCRDCEEYFADGVRQVDGRCPSCADSFEKRRAEASLAEEASRGSRWPWAKGPPPEPAPEPEPAAVEKEE